MMISKVKPLHQKVDETTQAVDDAEHKMSTLENKRKALEVRLSGLAKGFEEATIDKNEQEEKTVKMKKMLETAAQLRKVGVFFSNLNKVEADIMHLGCPSGCLSHIPCELDIPWSIIATALKLDKLIKTMGGFPDQLLKEVQKHPWSYGLVLKRVLPLLTSI